MSLKCWRIIVITCLLPMVSAVQAAGPYPRMFVFGDSISDTGNLIAMIPPHILKFPKPFYKNHISNGQVALELVANDVTPESLKPYFVDKANGTNFAIAGARVDGTGFVDAKMIDLDAQISHFWDSVDAAGGVFPEDSLIAFEIGGNDVMHVRDYSAADAAEDIDSTLDIYRDKLLSLSHIQKNDFLIVNMPDISLMPYLIDKAGGDAVQLTKWRNLALQFNNGLSNRINEVRADSNVVAAGSRFFVFDLFAFSQSIAAGTAGEAFDYTQISCLDDYKPKELLLKPWKLTCAEECGKNARHLDKFMFFDKQHFSARAHDLIAQEILATL